VVRVVAAVLLLLTSMVLSTPINAANPLSILLINMLWRSERPLHPIGDHDIATWHRPHRFSLHCREGWWVLVSVVLSFALSYAMFVAWGEQRHLPYWTGMARELLVTIPGFAFAGLYWWMVWRVGGWVTIDAQARTLAWRDTWSRWATDRQPRRTWELADVRSVALHRTAFGATAHVDVGDRVLRLRAPTADVPDLAASLWRAAVAQRAERQLSAELS